MAIAKTVSPGIFGEHVSIQVIVVDSSISHTIIGGKECVGEGEYLAFHGITAWTA